MAASARPWAASMRSSPRHTRPSPSSARATSARLVRSPVPSEPSSRVNGVSPALSAPTSASSSSLGDAAPRRRRSGWRASPSPRARRAGEDEAGAAGMAAQEVEPVAVAVILGDPVGAQRPDAGGHAVELVAARQQRRDGVCALGRCAARASGESTAAAPSRAMAATSCAVRLDPSRMTGARSPSVNAGVDMARHSSGAHRRDADQYRRRDGRERVAGRSRAQRRRR